MRRDLWLTLIFSGIMAGISGNCVARGWWNLAVGFGLGAIIFAIVICTEEIAKAIEKK